MIFYIHGWNNSVASEVERLLKQVVLSIRVLRMRLKLEVLIHSRCVTLINQSIENWWMVAWVHMFTVLLSYRIIFKLIYINALSYGRQYNIANPYIKMLKNEQNKIKAEKIKSFFSFPGNFFCLLFIIMLKNKFNFLRMMQN